MTAKILKSEAILIEGGFAPAVTKHAEEMKAWSAHMKRVEQDKGKEEGDPSKHNAYPRPDAHPLVDAAVDENGNVDYEIVNDDPTPEQKLAEKKNNMLALVNSSEIQAMEIVFPSAKRRFVSIKMSDLNAKKMKAQVENPEAKIEDIFSSDELKFFNDETARAEKIQAIDLLAAQMQYEIDELDVNTVDSWQIKPFLT